MIRSLFALAGAAALLTSFALAAPPRSPASPRSPHSPPPLPAAGASPSASAASLDLGVWTVHASSLDANFKTGDFSTPAKVVMTRVGGDVTADRANGNYKKQVLYLNGHVVMHDAQGGASLEGGGSHAASPSTLTADKAQVDGAAKIYKAIGNVHYVQADTVVTADNGTLNEVAHDLLLEGSVHIVSGSRSMNARRLTYNTLTGNAHAEGNVTMEFPNEFHRRLATPKPLKIPKNGLTEPVGQSSGSP